jgi:hypothetical protein
MYITAVALVLGASALGSGSASGEDSYFVTVLAHQGVTNRLRLAHSFAVFTKVSGNDKEKVENHTISWLPANADIKIVRLRPEAGKNFDLKTTLDMARMRGLRVSVWGPFSIKKELYDLGLRRIAELDSGKFGFIALDGRDRGNGAMNCIHALSDLDPRREPLETGTAHGEAASELVVEHLRPSFLPKQPDTSWLRRRLGLSEFELRSK